MDKISECTKHILIRYSNYKKYDFIEEHLKIIGEYGYTWLMKSGRKINPQFIANVKAGKGGLILKSPIKAGNSFYYCELVRSLADNIDYYPEYYVEFMKENGISNVAEAGTWFKIKSIQKLDDQYIDDFLLLKNQKKIKDVISKTRTAVMFIENQQEIPL